MGAQEWTTSSSVNAWRCRVACCPQCATWDDYSDAVSIVYSCYQDTCFNCSSYVQGTCLQLRVGRAPSVSERRQLAWFLLSFESAAHALGLAHVPKCLFVVVMIIISSINFVTSEK